MTKIKKVLLETSTMCQLRCPICPTGQRKTKDMVVGWGYLKFKDFKKFVDTNPNIEWIELSNFGEIFLNPELKNIIKYSYFKKIKLSAGNGVNLNNVSKEVLEYLIKYKFNNLVISLDGASNETYSIYRRGGNFEKVIKNIEIINDYKKQYSSEFPKLTWQFVIFGHNEHELPIARKMAKKLNMTFRPKLNWNASFSPVKDKEFVRKESGLGVADRKEHMQKTKKIYCLSCYQLWDSPQINWDGKLLGCCWNSDFGDFGVNVFESGLDNCLKSEKYVYAKKMLLGKKPARSDIPCYKCSAYPKFAEIHKKNKYKLLIPNFFKKYLKKIIAKYFHKK